MTLSTIIGWLDANGLWLLGVGAALVAVYKSLPAPWRDAFEKRHPRLVGAVRALAHAMPDVLGALRVLRHQVVAGQPRQTPARDTQPETPRAREGHVPVAALAWLSGALTLGAMAVALGAALAGCPLPPRDGCTPLDTRCAPDGVPEVCSSTQRWTRHATSGPCSGYGAGAVCCRVHSQYGRLLHACAPAAACVPEQPATMTEVDGGR